MVKVKPSIVESSFSMSTRKPSYLRRQMKFSFFLGHLSPLLRLLGMMKGLWVTVVTLTSVPSRVVCPSVRGSNRRRRNIAVILKSEEEINSQSFRRCKGRVHFPKHTLEKYTPEIEV